MSTNLPEKNLSSVNMFGRIKSWWRKQPVASFRVFVKDEEGREVVIGLLKNVCPDELDDRVQLMQANWYWERVSRNMQMGRVIGPQVFTVRVEPYELA